MTASFGGVLLLYVALFLLRHPLLRQHYLHNHLRLLLVTRYTSPYAIRDNAFLRPLPEGRNQCVTLIRPMWPCRMWYKCLSSTYYYYGRCCWVVDGAVCMLLLCVYYLGCNVIIELWESMKTDACMVHRYFISGFGFVLWLRHYGFGLNVEFFNSRTSWMLQDQP